MFFPNAYLVTTPQELCNHYDPYFMENRGPQSLSNGPQITQKVDRDAEGWAPIAFVPSPFATSPFIYH